jgi:short-subunit dehydrogenase
VGKLNLAARRLQDEFEAEIELVRADLSTEAGVQALIGALGDRRVEVLVNNAGFASYGSFVAMKRERELAEVRLNVEAVVHLCQAVIPAMVRRGQGRVLNVASTAAFMPGPLMSTYYATKAFVLSFSLGLAGELLGTGVTVTALCPGPTRTGFVARAHLEDSKLFQRRLMSAVVVAIAGWRGMMAGKLMVIPGKRNWLEVHALRLVPQWLLVRLVKRAQQRKSSGAKEA